MRQEAQNQSDNRLNQAQNDSSGDNNMSQSELTEYVITKVEKVSQALYVLTGYLPTEEPFRRNVREKALSMIDDLYKYHIDSQPSSAALSRIVSLKFNELTSILQVGVRAGLMSEMNFNVLMSEMKKLQELVSNRMSETKPFIGSGFFKTTKQDQKRIAAANDLNQETESNVDVANVSVESSTNKFSSPYSSQTTNTNTTKSQTSSGPDNSANKLTDTTNKPSFRRRHGRNHSKRRQGILGLFRENEEITINDVQQVIEGCSQKTMQRELKSMVDDGLLEKHGKRRWSSYTLGKGMDLETELR